LAWVSLLVLFECLLNEYPSLESSIPSTIQRGEKKPQTQQHHCSGCCYCRPKVRLVKHQFSVSWLHSLFFSYWKLLLAPVNLVAYGLGSHLLQGTLLLPIPTPLHFSLRGSTCPSLMTSSWMGRPKETWHFACWSQHFHILHSKRPPCGVEEAGEME
jgi:hypothetical protein